MNVNELPDEMLCSIFDELDVYELKIASLVCRRWSELTFSGRRMDRVLLVIHNFKRKFLFNTKRKYRHVNLRPYVPGDTQVESLARLLHIRKLPVRMLDIEYIKSSKQLGSILREVPALQHLRIDFSAQIYRKQNAPFRVLPELKSLNRRQRFSFFRTNMPNLQCLEMHCWTDLELEAWKYFSGQLKHVTLYGLNRHFLQPFLKLTFPLAKDFDLNGITIPDTAPEMYLSLGGAFFRRHPFLHRLSISCMNIPVEWVASISQHCPEITHLELRLNDQNEGFLEPLVQLAKLKHLSLKGKADGKFFRGVMASLESVELNIANHLVLLENLFEVVPRLNCLKVDGFVSFDEVQFICEKFSLLRRLDVMMRQYGSVVAADSVRFDALMHLQELSLSSGLKIRSIHRNKVQCLTLFQSMMLGDEVNLVPEKFPFLKRLILRNECVTAADVKWLHRMMPECRIDYDYGKKRLYPIADVTADCKAIGSERKCSFGLSYSLKN